MMEGLLAPARSRLTAASLAATVASIVAAALAGCSVATPPERFYSLSAGEGAAQAMPAAASAADPAGAAQALYIEVLGVNVPQQVSRNQLVVLGDGGRIELLEQQRWAAPLASEIGQALSLRLSGELGAIDIFRTPAPEQAVIYRISTNVQRFESAPGRYALVDAVWSVRRVGSTQVQTCRTVAEEKVAPGYDALVAGHRRAIARLSTGIAQSVRAAASGKSYPAC